MSLCRCRLSSAAPQSIQFAKASLGCGSTQYVSRLWQPSVPDAIHRFEHAGRATDKMRGATDKSTDKMSGQLTSSVTSDNASEPSEVLALIAAMTHVVHPRGPLVSARLPQRCAKA